MCQLSLFLFLPLLAGGGDGEGDSGEERGGRRGFGERRGGFSRGRGGRFGGGGESTVLVLWFSAAVQFLTLQVTVKDRMVMRGEGGGEDLEEAEVEEEEASREDHSVSVESVFHWQRLLQLTGHRWRQ